MTRPVPAPHRTGVRCRRCARTQPALPPGVFHCLYCGTPLPLQRWVARPPDGVRTGPRARRRRPGRYIGPPSYRSGFPGWGFPPSVWKWLDDEPPPRRTPPPVSALRSAAIAAVVTAVCCAAAAAGETWRFVLMLRGRTEVLSGTAVAASDAVVDIASWIAMVCAMVTAVIAVPALVRGYRAAADFAGLQAPRSERNAWLRLVAPVWNAYGAGIILTEIEGMLTGSAAARAAHQPAEAASERGSPQPRVSALVRWWWAFWAISTVLVLVTIGRAFGGSLQAIADTVQLHIAVDLVATAVAALAGGVLLRIARLFAGPRPGRYAGWSVAPASPTRDRPSAADASAARRRSGVLPPDDAELVAARQVRPVTRDATPAAAGSHGDDKQVSPTGS